mgnify:CR=1 FL=1
MTFSWHDLPTKAEARHFIGGDKPAAVFRIGKYEVTVPGEDRDDITYRVPYHTNTNPRSTLPNMDISDGEIRISLSDLVDETLSRLSPVELAQALWSNQEVREAFCDALTGGWNSEFTDQERRRVLRELKEAVHSIAQDKLSSSMAKLEYDVAKRSFFYHEVGRVNESLYESEQQLRHSTGNEALALPRLKHEDHDPDFKIGGKHWNEARDFWRKEVAARFPIAEAEQEQPVEEPAF